MTSVAQPATTAVAPIPGDDSWLEFPKLVWNPTGFLHERFERHGRVWKTHITHPCVFAIGEEANRTILITRRDDLSVREGYSKGAIGRLFENSILREDGEAHAHTRAILGPAATKLSAQKSAAAVHAIWRHAIDRAAQGGVVDAYTLAQRTTFEVSAGVLVGVRLGTETDRFRKLFETLIAGAITPFLTRVPGSRLDRALRAREALVKLLEGPIDDARRAKPSGLLGQLAHHVDEDGSTLPTRRIAEHVLLLAWAGYDTTASASSWVLHVLSQRPDLQERLRAELLRANEDLEAVDSPKDCPVLDWMLLEIERMYPSVIFFPRVALEEIELHGFVIPKDMTVYYSPYMSGRDPDLFDHPNSFRPERWNPGLGKDRVSPSKLVGFGGGPRVCLGKSFARTQLKMMIHTTLTRFVIEPDPTAKVRLMGLPIHHPIDARIRFEPIH